MTMAEEALSKPRNFRLLPRFDVEKLGLQGSLDCHIVAWRLATDGWRGT
jgi:hypothetical protein